MSLGQIIRDKREQLGLTLDEVSGRVDFSKPYLSTIETGKVRNPPSDELLVKLERVLQFEPGSLLYIAHMERAPADLRERFESAQAENERMRELLKRYEQTRGGPGAKSPARARPSPSPGAGTLTPGRLVPIINRVAAGYPSDFNDLDYPVGVADDYVRCPDLHDINAFAVRVVGDSMEPKFRQGDIVVFSPAAEVQNGDDCFIRFASPHETTFKRVFFEPENKIRLQPRNDRYAPTIMDSGRINGLYRAVARVERL